MVENNNMHGLKRMSEENTVSIKFSFFCLFKSCILLKESANKLYGQVRELRTRKNTPNNCLKDMLVHGRVSYLHSEQT